MPLKDLVADLIRDKSLRRRFVDDPETVMDEYRLFKKERRVLRTMDKGKLKGSLPAEMHDDIDDFNVPPGEFPPASDDFLIEGGGADAQYPSPEPALFRYRINPAFAYGAGGVRGFSLSIVNGTASKAIEVTVFGQSLSDVNLKLIRTLGGAGDAQPTHFFQLGTFRNSIVRAVFSPPPGAPGGNWVLNDEYAVTVINLHRNAALAKTLTAAPVIKVLA